MARACLIPKNYPLMFYLHVVRHGLPSTNLDPLAGDAIREVVVQLVVAKTTSVQRPDSKFGG